MASLIRQIVTFIFAICFWQHVSAQLNEAEPVEIKSVTPVYKGNRLTYKTTSYDAAWFSAAALLYKNGVSKSYYYPIYSDSTVFSTGGSSPAAINTYGMGLSFDPTDSIFLGGNADQVTTMGTVVDLTYCPSFVVFGGNSYIVDSLSIPIQYRAFSGMAYNDSVYVQLIKTENPLPFGVYAPQFQVKGASPDGIVRYVTALYDRNTNRFSDSIAIGKVVTMGFKLSSSDTDAGGYQKQLLDIGLPVAMNIDPGQKVMIWVSYKSGGTYTLGTSETAANTIRMFTYDFAGNGAEPKQNKASYYAGMIATSQSKYGAPYGPYNSFSLFGHLVPIPSFAFSIDNKQPDIAVHVRCADCFPTHIVSSQAQSIIANAFPNPANESLSVYFQLDKLTEVKLSLMNSLGQVITTQNITNTRIGKFEFSTANLPAGVYFYCVKADNEYKSYRIVVAH